jgi:HK97 family phage major capsid protein
VSFPNAGDCASGAQSIIRLADAEGRDLTVEERWQVERLLREAERLNGKTTHAIGYHLGSPGNVSPYGIDYGAGPGDLFVKSAGFRKIASPDTRPQSWSTGPVDVGRSILGKAGTALESGQGGGFLPVPQVLGGVVDTLFEPLTVAVRFGQAEATTSSVRYMIEGTATSGAAGVAEGAEKPASDIAVSTVDEPVKKVATVLTVSDELFEDAPNVSAYLNGRLSLFVRMEEERQLLRGAGTNELVGIFGRSGINTDSKAAADDNATALARVLANTAGSANVAPDTIVLHPQNWLTTRLLRDGAGGTVGQFQGGGPFSGAYGGAAPSPGLFGQSLWGVPVVLSTQVGAGTALVGNFRQSATIYRRGGVSVEASNSHDQFFTYNLIAIRAEARQALAVFRPGAFTQVSGLA